MNILPIKPFEALAVRPVTMTLPDNIIPTLPWVVAGGNTGIVPPYMLDHLRPAAAVAGAVEGARNRQVNPGVVPPWMVDGAEFTPGLVAPDEPVDMDTPRIL